MAGEEYPIVVAIRPGTENAAVTAKIGADLDGLATRGKAASDQLSRALEGVEKGSRTAGDAASLAFAHAAEKMLLAAKEAKEWDQAIGRAKTREHKREIDELGAAFGKLERSTLASVRAEHEYAEAERTVTAAVKAGLATEQQARAVLEEKAKALEHVAVAQQASAAAAAEAELGIKAYDDAIRISTLSTRESTSAIGSMWDKLKGVGGAVAQVGDMFGKVRMAIDLVTMGFEASEKAARAAIAAWRSIDDSGPSSNLDRGSIVTTRHNRVFQHPEQFGLKPGWDAPGGTADSISAISRINTLVETFHGLNEDFDDEIKSIAKEIAVADARLTKQREERRAGDDAYAAQVRDAWKDGGFERLSAAAAQLESEIRAQVAAEAKTLASGHMLTQGMKKYDAELARRAAALNQEIAVLDSNILGPVDRGAIESEMATRTQLAKTRTYDVGAATGWEQVADDIALAGGYLKEYLVDMSTAIGAADRLRESAGYKAAGFGRGIGKIGGALGSIGDTLGGWAEDQQLEKKITDAEKFAAALEGPVASAIDGLVEGLVRWEMNWKDWGRTALEQISKVMLQLLILQGIEAAFGSFGGSSKFGQLLWGAFGGGARPSGGGGSSARFASGDPFGGAGRGPAPIVTERVMAQRRRAGGEQAPGATVIAKTVVVADMTAAAREFAQSSEGERVFLVHAQKNAGKLGLRGGGR